MASPDTPTLVWWKRCAVGARAGASTAASASTAVLACLMWVYWDHRASIPPDQVLTFPGLLLTVAVLVALAALYWSLAGLHMGLMYPEAHLPFIGACWGVLGSFVLMFSSLVKLGVKLWGGDPVFTPAHAWFMGLMLIGVLIVVGLTGLLGWAIGGRIHDRLKYREMSGS